jgi:hypothetical protein
LSQPLTWSLASGAGPYSMVARISAILFISGRFQAIA